MLMVLDLQAYIINNVSLIPSFLSKIITYGFVNDDCSLVYSVEKEHDKPSEEYIIEHIINHVSKLLH